LTLTLLSTLALARTIDGVPEFGATVEAFVPSEWIVESKTPADLNGDGLEDMVLVIVAQKGDDNQQRGIVWLHGVKGAGFRRIDTNLGLLECVGCGGARNGNGTPDIIVEKKVVSFSQYGGSGAGPWDSTYSFRFTKAGVCLFDHLSYFNYVQINGTKKKTTRKNLSKRKCSFLNEMNSPY
jgi:hypothetical protein